MIRLFFYYYYYYHYYFFQITPISGRWTGNNYQLTIDQVGHSFNEITGELLDENEIEHPISGSFQNGIIIIFLFC